MKIYYLKQKFKAQKFLPALGDQMGVREADPLGLYRYDGSIL